MQSKKILMLSDTHFSENNQLLFGSYDAKNSFEQLSNSVLVEEPDYIFVTGDISQDGSVASYLTAKDKLSKFNCPKYVIKGNHDSDNIKYLLTDDILMQDYIDIGKHRFIFVSSYKGDGFNEGFVYPDELEKINQYSRFATINHIITHHHFIPMDSIMDTAILENHTEFCNVLLENSICAVFHGHVHLGYDIKLKHINVHANPSTCVQFAWEKHLKLEPIIGYRIVNLLGNSYDSKSITKSV